MKKTLLLLTFLLLMTSIATATTTINSVSLSGTDFLTEYVLKANITSNDTISPNLTLIYPTSQISYYNLTLNGTSGLYESPVLFGYPDGFYEYIVRANTTYSIGNYTIYDKQTMTLTTFTQSNPTGTPFSIYLTVNTSTPATIAYHTNCEGLTNNLSCIEENFNITSIGNRTIVITTTNVPEGDYNGTLQIIRDYDNRTTNVSLTLSVLANLGIPEIQNLVNLAVSMYTDETKSKGYTIKNIGNYNLTNCYASLDGNLVNKTFWYGTPNFNLAINESKIFTITYANPPAGTYAGYLNVLCNASPTGTLRGLASENQPYQQLFVVQAVPSGGGGGGGPITTKVDCHLNFTKSKLVLQQDLPIDNIVMFNLGDTSYTPSITFRDGPGTITSLKTDLQLTNPIGTVLSGNKVEFGVKFLTPFHTGTTTLVLSSDKCLDVVLPIEAVNSTSLVATLSTEASFVDKTISVLNEPILQQFPAVKIYVLFGLLIVLFFFLFANSVWATTPIMNFVLKFVGILFLSSALTLILTILLQELVGGV